MAGMPWQPWEIEVLEDVSLSFREVSACVGRTYEATLRKASYLGIRRPVDWTAAEDALIDDVSLSYQEVVALTGRTLAAVQRRAFLRGVHRGRWADDQRLLLQDESLTYAEIAERVGRSENTVKQRAYGMGIRRWAKRGEAHPNWVGGASKRDRSWRGEDWPQVRKTALERDGYCCQDCGLFDASAVALRVHHLIPYRLLPSNDLCWLLTLCEPCHRKRPEHRWREIPEDVQLVLSGRWEGGDQSA